MKKRWIVIGAVLIVIVITAILMHPFYIPRSLEKTVGVDFSKVTKVKLWSSINGHRSVTLEGEDLKNFLKMFDDTRLTKSLDQRIRNGEGMSLALYYGSDRTGSFAFSLTTIMTGGRRYNSSTEFDRTGLENKYFPRQDDISSGA